MIVRECEVILDVTTDYDGDEIEVTCGRVAEEKIHDWWMCAECRAEALLEERLRKGKRGRLRPVAKAEVRHDAEAAPLSRVRPARGAA